MLHEPRALSKPRSYPDFNDWWRGKGTCINGSWRKYDQAKANFEKSSRQGFCAYSQCHFFKFKQQKRLLILMHIYGILAVPSIYFCFLIHSECMHKNSRRHFSTTPKKVLPPPDRKESETISEKEKKKLMEEVSNNKIDAQKPPTAQEES